MTESETPTITESTINDGTPPSLRDSLSILGWLDETLPQRTLDYVLHGEPVSVLDEFTAQAVASELAGSPGRLFYGFYAWSVEKPVRKLIKAGLKARHQFYALLGGPDALPLAAYVRLGRLLEAMDQGQSLQKIMVPGLPKWFQYLANDALHACMCWNSTPLNEDSRGAWTLNLMHELLVNEGLDGTLALRHALERKGIADEQHINFDWLLREPSLHEYVARHGDAFNALPEQLSSAGRCLLARVVADSPLLLQQHGEVLVRLLLDKSQLVRGKASRRIERLEPAFACARLGERLISGPAAQRKLAAEALGLHFAKLGRKALEAGLAHEQPPAVRQAIQAALLKQQAARSAAIQTPLIEPPPYSHLPDSKLGEAVYQLLQENRAALLDSYREQAEQEIEANKTASDVRFQSAWRQKQYADYQTLDEDALREALSILNDNDHPGQLTDLQATTLVYGERIFDLPQLSLYHMIRLLQGFRYYRLSYFWHEPYFQRWLSRQPAAAIDLRALAEVTERMGLGRGAIAGACLCDHHNELKPWDQLPNERIWPFFAHYPDLIEEGLGIRPKKPERYHAFDIGMTLGTLETYPYLPALFVPRLMELALGESKVWRTPAQKLLSRLTDIGQQVAESLDAPKQEVRIAAAEWLAAMQCRDAIPALRQALSREKRESARAALLAALEHMGEDIAPSPQRLLADAEKGMKSGVPDHLAWFPFAELPDCRWATDGAAVGGRILTWWIVLAGKLKAPGGNALLHRYLSLLDADSRAALGRFVLRQFIAQDTRHPSQAEAEAFARANAEQRHQYYQESAQRWSEHYAEQGRLTARQVFDELLNEKLAEYAGSAISDKGLLALTVGMPGDELAAAVRDYLRQHYQRRAQIEALLEALSRSDHPAALDVLLSLARRYRTASVQNRARALLDDVAARLGWDAAALEQRIQHAAAWKG